MVNRKNIVIITLLFLVTIGLSPIALTYVKENKRAIIQQPVVTYFIPTYRSLRKIGDLFFAPFILFSKNEYPYYLLTIDPHDIQSLNELLPETPFDPVARLTDDRKIWVPAKFSSGDYVENVKVRYRGNQANHWGSYKKSFVIRFPKDNLFEGKRDLTLVIPSDRRYFGMSLNNYRSKKMGLLVPDEKLVTLNFNGADHGVYLAFEKFSQEWLEKNPVSSNSILYNTADVKSDVLNLPSLHSHQGLQYWQSPNVDDLEVYQKPLRALVEVVSHTDDETFAKLLPVIVDMDQLYSREIIAVLTGSFHNAGPVAGANNLVMYFDATVGKFKFIPYNSVVFPPEDGFDGQPTDLELRVWSIPEFKIARDQAFTDYVTKNKTDDLKFLDDWMSQNKSSMYADFAKDETNLSFWLKMKELSQSIKDYYNNPFDVWNRPFEYTTQPDPKLLSELVFQDSFEYLTDVIKSPETFVRENPQFYIEGANIVLPRGKHHFDKTVIVPMQTHLEIHPGADLVMGEGVSIISYSSVNASGTQWQPITVRAKNNDKNWGVFAVINTEGEESTFSQVSFSGGGEDTINGVYYSGMLALHNADGLVTKSEFKDTSGDDGINIKQGNVLVDQNLFIENNSDGLDIDYPHGSTTVINNLFVENYGDSIDLSWSDIIVTNNEIRGCGDKGISAGESSRIVVIENIVSGCSIGIAAKDFSVVEIYDSIFSDNRIGIAAYQKKEFFGGGTVSAFDTELIGNKQKSLIGPISTVTLDGEVI